MLYLKPKFKNFYPIIERDFQTIQIGDEPNFAYELVDSEGILRKIIPLLNGNLNKNEILESLVNEEISIEDLDMVLEVLDDICLIENDIEAEALTEWQRVRYNNNLNFFNIKSDLGHSKESFQKKLIDSKILVLGMGGLGSNLLMQLSGLGVGNIKCLDCDIVELKNLNRQVLYSEEFIGQRKTEVGINRLSNFNTNITYESFDKRIESMEDLKGLITKDLDFVFCAADYPPLKINSWVNKLCNENKVPFISGGVGLACGSFYAVVPSETACLECYYQYIKENHGEFIEAFKTSPIDFNAAIMPNIALLASMMSSEFLRIFLNISEPISVGRKVIVNFLTSEITFDNTWMRNSQCPVCSS